MRQYGQAYVDGFSKAAEEAGVDPASLAKCANLLGMIGKGIGMIGRGAGAAARGAKRYGELMAGGNKMRISPFSGVAHYERETHAGLPFLGRLRNAIGTRFNALAGRMSANLPKSTDPAIVDMMRGAEKELRGVYAARGATGLGLAFGGGAAASAYRDSQAAG